MRPWQAFAVGTPGELGSLARRMRRRHSAPASGRPGHRLRLTHSREPRTIPRPHFGETDLVFTRIIHCLTIVAFAAHVSLGCCLHHTHGDSTAVCAHQRGNEESGDSHEHDHDHEHCASERGDAVDGHESSPTPCDHSPQCEQGRCTFVTSESRADNFTSTGVYLQVTASSYVVDEPASIESRIDRLLRIGWPSASLRCALQQSWQI